MPEEINLDIFNADPITEDVSDEATEAAPKTYAPLDAAAESQADLSAEMKAIGEAYAQALKDGAPAETQPRLDYAPYRSSVLRHPTKEPAPRGPGNHRTVLAGVRAHGRPRAGSRT